MYMIVPITKFRKDIFSFAEAALKGTVVEFTHKGVTFKVVPEQSTGAVELQKEMTKEWEKDWSQL